MNASRAPSAAGWWRRVSVARQLSIHDSATGKARCKNRCPVYRGRSPPSARLLATCEVCVDDSVWRAATGHLGKTFVVENKLPHP